MMKMMLFLILLLFFLVFGVWLQIFLSKKENKWLGLILPLLTFLYSVLMVANVMAGPGAYVTMVSVVLIFNIPTLILLAIYLACRESRKKKKLMDKTKIQDL